MGIKIGRLESTIRDIEKTFNRFVSDICENYDENKDGEISIFEFWKMLKDLKDGIKKAIKNGRK